MTCLPATLPTRRKTFVTLTVAQVASYSYTMTTGYPNEGSSNCTVDNGECPTQHREVSKPAWWQIRANPGPTLPHPD